MPLKRHQLNLMQGELYCTLIENTYTKSEKTLKYTVEGVMPKRTNIIVRCIYRHLDNIIDYFNTLPNANSPKNI